MEAVANNLLDQQLTPVALNTTEKIDEYLNSGCLPDTEYTLYKRCVNLIVEYPAWSTGGVFYLEGFLRDNTYGWQIVTRYLAGGILQYGRSMINGVWNNWVALNSYSL